MPTLEERIQRLKERSLEERLSRLKDQEPAEGRLFEEPASSERVFAESAGRSILDNVLGIPDLLLTAGARFGGNRPLLTDEPLFKPPFLSDEQIEKLQDSAVQFPQLGERVLPIPRVGDISEEMRQDSPKAAFAG